MARHRHKPVLESASNAFLTANEAATALGISKATLYAYVSRGMIRADTHGATKIKSYWREDVESLLRRKEFRRDPVKVAESALAWGAPALPSAITCINESELYYRGHSALTLAHEACVEEVAAMMWLGDLQRGREFFTKRPKKPDWWNILEQQRKWLSHFELLQMFVTLHGSGQPHAYDHNPERVAQTGAELLQLMACALTRSWRFGKIEEVLARGWKAHGNAAQPLIRQALILCADHELNVSTFVGRCAASAGAPLHCALSAALAAFRGPKHGGASDHVEALFDEVSEKRNAHAVIFERLSRGDRIRGFGHPLYPQEDPRAKSLLETLYGSVNKNTTAAARELITAMQEAKGLYPNLDFALVTMRRALKLPPGSAMLIFALGRTIGWIAHTIEEYQRDKMIRPRARYIGPLPDVRA